MNIHDVQQLVHIGAAHPQNPLQVRYIKYLLMKLMETDLLTPQASPPETRVAVYYGSYLPFCFTAADLRPEMSRVTCRDSASVLSGLFCILWPHYNAPNQA